MREAVFILIVIAGLLAWTAFRYRKTIAGMIGFAKMLKEAKDGLVMPKTAESKTAARGSTLVNCSTCGVWVPQTKARKKGDVFFCSDACVSNQAKV